MATAMSQSAFAEANGLTILRNFAQSRANTLDPLPYQLAPMRQPRDYLSWPWMKKEKLLREYLCFNRETPFFSDLKIDYSPLLWCKTAREEALKFFCEENYLIRVTLYAQEDQKELDPSAILLPRDELQVPIELFDDAMFATLEAGLTLRLQLGEGCGTGPTTRSTNVVYDKIFGYTKYTWADYCQTLATNGVRIYDGMIINLHQRYRSKFRELVPNFLLELAHIRSAGKVWLAEMTQIKFFDTLATAMSEIPSWPWQWHDLLIGLIEESQHRVENDSLNAGFVTLSRAKSCAEIALQHMAVLVRDPDLEQHVRRHVNGTYALCTKIFVTYLWTLHHLVDYRYGGGPYHPDAFVYIIKMQKAMFASQVWPGMGPKQLAGCLFVAGIFHIHVASFLCTPANVKTARKVPMFQVGFDIDAHRQQAAHYLYAAAKICPTKFGELAMNTWKALYTTHGNGRPREFFIPKLETLSTRAGGEWFGPATMWDKWGREKLHYLEQLQDLEISKLSKAQMKKSRDQMGVSNCRKDGLLRCMIVGGP